MSEAFVSEAHRKISSPGYVRHTVAGLDDLFSRAANPVGADTERQIEPAEKARDEQPPVSTDVTEGSIAPQPGSRTETIEAADLLDFLYAQDQEPPAVSKTMNASTGAAAETILDASSIISEPCKQGPPVSQATNLPSPLPAGRRPSEQAAGVKTIVSKLEEVHSQLQSANFRIGYLESEIARSKQRLKLLPDLEAQAKKAEGIEKENQELRNRLATLEINARKLPALERENEELIEQLEDLTYRKSRPWWQFWTLFTGSNQRPVKTTNAHQAQRRRYY